MTAFGLPPGAHAAHLHLGSCQDQGGVKYMLMDFVANPSGDIVDQARTVTGVTAPPQPSGWYLSLHLGASSAIVAHGMPTLSFRPELCANITSVRMAGHRCSPGGTPGPGWAAVWADISRGAGPHQLAAGGSGPVS